MNSRPRIWMDGVLQFTSCLCSYRLRSFYSHSSSLTHSLSSIAGRSSSTSLQRRNLTSEQLQPSGDRDRDRDIRVIGRLPTASYIDHRHTSPWCPRLCRPRALLSPRTPTTGLHSSCTSSIPVCGGYGRAWWVAYSLFTFR